ncbi:hypothetical protein [Pseudomonas sp. S2_B03]
MQWLCQLVMAPQLLVFLPDWSWLDALSRGVLRFFGAQDQKIAAFGSSLYLD